VLIDPSFSSSQKAIILDQLSKWSNAGGANITFQEKTPSTAGPGACCGGDPIYFISKETPSFGSGVQGESSGYGGGWHTGDSFTNINPGVTDSTAFTHTVSHEFGHTFGLDDCITCPQGSSAMTLPNSPSLNAAGGHDGPTSCDASAAQQAGGYSGGGGGGGG